MGNVTKVIYHLHLQFKFDISYLKHTTYITLIISFKLFTWTFFFQTGSAVFLKAFYKYKYHHFLWVQWNAVCWVCFYYLQINALAWIYNNEVQVQYISFIPYNHWHSFNIKLPLASAHNTQLWKFSVLYVNVYFNPT